MSPSHPGRSWIRSNAFNTNHVSQVPGIGAGGGKKIGRALLFVVVLSVCLSCCCCGTLHCLWIGGVGRVRGVVCVRGRKMRTGRNIGCGKAGDQAKSKHNHKTFHGRLLSQVVSPLSAAFGAIECGHQSPPGRTTWEMDERNNRSAA